MNENYFKLEVLVPEEYKNSITEVFNKYGIGRTEKYDSYITYSYVTSSWRPLENSKPFRGRLNELHEEKEIKIETICPKDIIEKVVGEIKKVHPYEEPVINAIPIIYF